MPATPSSTPEEHDESTCPFGHIDGLCAGESLGLPELTPEEREYLSHLAELDDQATMYQTINIDTKSEPERQDIIFGTSIHKQIEKHYTDMVPFTREVSLRYQTGQMPQRPVKVWIEETPTWEHADDSSMCTHGTSIQPYAWTEMMLPLRCMTGLVIRAAPGSAPFWVDKIPPSGVYDKMVHRNPDGSDPLVQEPKGKP